MNLLIRQLTKRKKYLVNLQKEVEKGLEDVPYGNLRISNDRGVPRYYHVTEPKDTRGKYIPKKQEKLAYQLAQRDYLKKLHERVVEELKDINLYLSKHGIEELESVYSDLNKYRQDIVEPLVLTDEMYVERWTKEAYVTNPYHPEEKVYPTKKDDLVRSKSEVLLADMYYELGIPYRYEAQLRLKNGKVRYPDFTILKVASREIIYHEHLGLLDHEDYLQTNLLKLNEYRKSGIYLGKNLFITYEAEGCPLNIKDVKIMVKELVEYQGE